MLVIGHRGWNADHIMVGSCVSVSRCSPRFALFSHGPARKGSPAARERRRCERCTEILGALRLGSQSNVSADSIEWIAMRCRQPRYVKGGCFVQGELQKTVNLPVSGNVAVGRRTLPSARHASQHVTNPEGSLPRATSVDMSCAWVILLYRYVILGGVP